MKLIRWTNGTKPATGIIINDEYYDTSSFGEDYNEAFFETDGTNRLQKFIESNKEKLPKLSKRYSSFISHCTSFKDHLHWTELCRSCQRN